MTLSRKHLFLALVIAALSTATLTHADPKSQIKINVTVAPGTKINVTGNEEASGFVFIQPKTSVTKAAPDCATDGPKFKIRQTFTLSGSVAQDLTLATTLAEGDQICLSSTDPAHPTPTYTDVFTVGAAQAPPASQITLNGPVGAGTTINVSGNDGATVYAYIQPKASVTKAAPDCAADGPKFKTHQTFTLSGGVAQDLTLATALAEGDQICLASTDLTHPTTYTAVLTVQAATTPASAAATSVSFAGKLIGGSSTLNVNAKNGDSITIYQFDDDFFPASAADNCAEEFPKHGRALSQTVSGQSSTTTAGKLTSDSPQTITLTEPLVAGTFLCLIETDSGKQIPSAFQIVTDPNSHGRAVFDFTAGSVISNQQSNSSSSAAVYLDLGFIFDFARPGGGPIPQTVTKSADHPDLFKPSKNFSTLRPGLEDFIDLRLTQVPVSTSTTTPSTATTSSIARAADTSSTPTNVETILSSQQSAVITGGFDFPWRLTRWSKNTNSFIIAPVAKAGFNTLLNPTVKTGTTTTTGATATTAPTFNSVYWFHSYGLRLGWYKFPNKSDDAPKSIAQLDMATGWFSNLPSNRCEPSKASLTTTTTLPTGTSCFVTSTVGGTTTYALDPSRTLIPRVRLDGFIKIPNTPVVIGLDANLAQYAFGTHLKEIDPLTKPGNDVRIYFGVSIDPLTAFKKIGLP
jgi:predicted lipoprotein with Yx(FWY)xxD motif